MQSRFFLFFFLMASAAALFSSCRKTEEYPVAPIITYNSFYKVYNGTNIDDSGVLLIDFTDGDGDVGLGEGDINAPFDSTSKFYYNFFIDYYEKQKGVYVKPTLYETYNARVPVLNTSVGKQALKGTISIQLPINNYTSPYDTIRFECQICDRALHLSNKITTPDIIVNKH